ncbi:AsmA-like C-terminal domain-containing protein [Sulfurimonas sp. NWX79]|uniref:YhdP family protein n=1 Tax=Sulfurimonas sp. NWX79 TaxID=2925412 RepID=UPI003204C7FD
MKDKRVISIISTTYVTIVSFLSFIFLSLIAAFIILQHGLYLDNVSFSNITIKNIYIKWNEKLNISIEELDIQKSKNSNSRVGMKDISKYLKLTSRFFLLTESVVIEKFQYADLKLSLKHNNKEKGFLIANSPSLHFDSHFKFHKHYLLFTIDKFSALDNKVSMHGDLILDTEAKKIFSKLHLLMNNDADLTLYAVADKKRLDYTIQSHKDIEHIKEIVSLFPLPKEVKFWAIDAIAAPSLTIHKFKGFLEYNDLPAAYKHIYVKATANKLNYTYNTKLDAVHTQRTELEFVNGTLFIRPKEAYSYGMYLHKSWLKIDFTKPQELLTLHLLFDGMLNKDMLYILSSYGIDLPFLQHSGKVQTDLTIAVNLRTIKVDAQGSFFTKKANFDYLGINIDISDTFIKLNNYDIDITSMKAHYREIADADVTVRYNAKKALGDINFKFTKIALDKNQHLDTKQKPLYATYKIAPTGDKIVVEKSQWYINGLHMTLDPLELPFDLNTLQLTIPTSYFTIEDISDGFITGEANLKRVQADLKVDLLKLKYQGIKLSQSNTELNLHYDKHLYLTSHNDIFLSVNGSQYKIKNLALQMNKKNIMLNHAVLDIGKYIKTDLSADFDIKKKQATVKLDNFILINPKNKKILYYTNKATLALDIKKEKEKIKITSKELNADFLLKKDRWVLNLNSIDIIAKNSQFLKKYNITNGKISFYKQNEDKYTKFKGTINYPYKLLTNKEKAISSYKIEGYLTKKQNLYLKINKSVNIKISNTIKINMNNSGINIEELLKFIALITEQNKTKQLQKPLDVFFEAENSYLYVGNNRYVISDRMNLQYYQGILTAQLIHANGKAGFKLDGEKFHLYGNNFNDKFMEKLLSLSKFKGGSLDFSMSGTFNDYIGTFYINNTTIQDYVILNNILAFINTVPSLATFSLPGYSKKGLHIDNAYMKFHSKNHIFDISDIYIGSKEIKILGKGTASVKYDNIDLTLNLKTDLGSNLSKVPVVGYIIFDGESISTTLKVTGKLTDPNVKTMLARDIAVAPLNIILRTLTLPYKIMKDIDDYNSSKDKRK